MSSSRVVRVHARDEVAAHSLRDGIARIQSRAQGDAGVPARGRGGRAAGPQRPRGCPISTAPTSRSSPSTRRRRWTSTRRSTSSARARATSCTTRSPTSRRSCSPATPSTSRPTSAARRSTAPTPRSRCTRPSLSEGAASLLPDQVGPALLWTIHVDDTGEGTDVHVERARVRSTGQARLRRRPAGRSTTARADESLLLLKEVGELRLAARGRARRHLAAAARAGGRGRPATQWSLEFRSLIPAETWNAQISLLTGFAAASLMVYARVGLLRTLPPPRPARRAAPAPHRPGAPHRLAGRAALPRLHPHPRLRASPPRPR